jgi:hypothetical protein
MLPLAACTTVVKRLPSARCASAVKWHAGSCSKARRVPQSGGARHALLQSARGISLLIFVLLYSATGATYTSTILLCITTRLAQDREPSLSLHSLGSSLHSAQVAMHLALTCTLHRTPQGAAHAVVYSRMYQFVSVLQVQRRRGRDPGRLVRNARHGGAAGGDRARAPHPPRNDRRARRGAQGRVCARPGPRGRGPEAARGADERRRPATAEQRGRAELQGVRERARQRERAALRERRPRGRAEERARRRRDAGRHARACALLSWACLVLMEFTCCMCLGMKR